MQDLSHPVEPQENVIDLIILYETGEADDHQIMRLFSLLIKSGQAWSLQGFYGRAAAQLIEQGLIAEDGTITPKGALL